MNDNDNIEFSKFVPSTDTEASYVIHRSVPREDIVAVEFDEDDPDEFLVVHLSDGAQFYYVLSEDNDQEEQEWLLGFAVDRDYTSRSY